MLERRTRDVEVRAPHPTLIRWGAIIGGGVLGLGIFIALSALWLALAYGSEVETIRQDIEWFIGGSAVMSLFLASYLAAWMQGVRGWNPGLMAGVTLWAITLLVVTLGAVPSLAALLPGSIENTPEQAATLATTAPLAAPLWATFISIAGTLLASALGGALGGATPRSEALYAPDGRPGMEQHDVEVHLRPEEVSDVEHDTSHDRAQVEHDTSHDRAQVEHDTSHHDLIEQDAVEHDIAPSSRSAG